MDYRYYIGEGPEAEALIAKALEKNTARSVASEALLNEYGADGLLLARWDANKEMLFKEKQTTPFLKGGKHIEHGYVYSPKLNCKAGKELVTKLANPALTFSVSSYIIESLGISCEVCTGIVFGKLLVKIPIGSHRLEDSMPTVPTWLREVKESEYLAIQGN